MTRRTLKKNNDYLQDLHNYLNSNDLTHLDRLNTLAHKLILFRFLHPARDGILFLSPDRLGDVYVLNSVPNPKGLRCDTPGLLLVYRELM